MAKCGKEAEVFSRVCGYHRPVKLWNLGKQEEFLDRLAYKPEVINETKKHNEVETTETL